ncbi:peptidoglycan binding domain-containing protein, partial [Streptomyces sp. ST2-7A]|uniref:peptidoglycan binding domain-containing protein n=1 Tax=Streptomyces sp. ST2-7A TaxID=2907214 RepID=UPI001F18F246
PSRARPPGDTLPPSNPGTGGTLPAPMIDPPPGGEPADGPVPPLPRRESGAALRQPAGPTTGPGTGAMEPLSGGPRGDGGGLGTPSGGVPVVAGEETFGSTMEPGGPLPHAETPPRSPLADRDTGAWSPRDPEATEAMPRLPEPFGTGSTTGARPGPVDGARFPAPAFGTSFGEEKPDHEADPDDYYEGYEEYEEEEPRRGRGRKLLILALVGVTALFVVAYGAGLLLSQDDVPKGTTVLGHDIGGTTTQTAVNRLDTVMEGPATAPLLLGIEGETVELLPAVAGLTIDTEATVREAASTDYNPVSVIGSLLGSGREVEPVFGVDEEKLDAALLDLADIGAAAPRDGSISFDTGAPVADYGQPGLAVDVASAAPAVREVFRLRAETGENPTVDVQTVEVEPEVGRAEVERAMEEFAEPAMSGLVTIVAGTDGVPGVAPTIQFSPENSLRQFLSMRPVDGRLVDHYDLETMASLYGSTFEQVTIVRGDGQSTPVTPEDVASVLRLTLLETGEENRVGYLDLDPN